MEKGHYGDYKSSPMAFCTIRNRFITRHTWEAEGKKSKGEIGSVCPSSWCEIFVCESLPSQSIAGFQYVLIDTISQWLISVGLPRIVEKKRMTQDGHVCEYIYLMADDAFGFYQSKHGRRAGSVRIIFRHDMAVVAVKRLWMTVITDDRDRRDAGSDNDANDDGDDHGLSW